MGQELSQLGINVPELSQLGINVPGLNISNPISEDNQKQINEILDTIMHEFSNYFPVSYSLELFRKVKEAKVGLKSWKDDLQLLEYAIPAAPIIEGMCQKRGDVNKGLKSRYLQAMNAADNYRVDYYDKKDGKLKGSINCAGYTCSTFDKDETANIGKFGLKLTSSTWSIVPKRVWYLLFENETEVSAWKKVLTNATHKAQYERDSDAGIADAFDNALIHCQQKMGYYSTAYYCGSESERLCEFVCQVIHDKVLRSVVDSLPDNSMKDTIRDTIFSTTVTVVRAACNAGWKSSVAALKIVKGQISSSVERLLDPILEQEVKARDQITSNVQTFSTPVVSGLIGSTCQPLISAALKPIADVFVAVIENYSAYAQKKLKSNGFKDDKIDATITKFFDFELWLLIDGPISSARSLSWALADDSKLTALVTSSKMQAISNIIHDYVFEIAQRATYTLGVALKNVTDKSAVFAEVMQKLVHDVMIVSKQAILDILNYLIGDKVKEEVVKPCIDLVQPVQATIDSIPVPGVKEFLDINSFLLQCIDIIVNNGFENLLKSSLSELETKYASAKLAV